MPEAFYWWAWGLDMHNKPVICGPFVTDDDARQDARDKINGIVNVVALPTKSMPKAKAMLRFKWSQDFGNLDDGMQPIRSR